MTSNGAIFIGGEERQSAVRFRGVNPATNAPSQQDFSESQANDVADACASAAQAAAVFGDLAPSARADFMDAVAQAILDIGDVLIETAMAESGLPRVRLEGERMRTVNQLRLFAAEVREGGWLDVTIDLALPDRAPPRSDLRRMNCAIGPVAIFGASNFPLAFSVAGGDTASAFAAGCPVVVKGHPAHPATGELVARAIVGVVNASGLPGGVFSFLPGKENALGAVLVSDPRIKAVGFTGSRAGGLALVDIASRRAEPIPVYAEMASINPVLLLPGALAANAEPLGKAFVASLTMGAGQFCTNPGLVIALASPDLDRFEASAAATLSAAEPAVMLTPVIHSAYAKGVQVLSDHPAATQIAMSSQLPDTNRCIGALFTTDAASFIADRALGHEIFGAAAIIVRCPDVVAITAVLEALEGQLTATLQFLAEDTGLAAQLLPLLTEKAGRVLANGWPTGVEVTHAMVHGGPYPATSDARSTSVGTLAMARFLRPVCYQDIPDSLLPLALHSTNPWGVPRRINGER